MTDIRRLALISFVGTALLLVTVPGDAGAQRRRPAPAAAATRRKRPARRPAQARGAPRVTPRAATPAASAPLWGTLDAGPNAVGFRNIIAFDVTRPALREHAGTSLQAQRGRRIPIHVWYPARPATGAAMTMSRYVRDAGRDVEPSIDPARQLRAGERLLLEASGGFGGDSAALRRGLPGLLALSVAARSDAAPVAGRHPVLLFPAYRAPFSVTVMAEFLASHGYIVVSPSLQGTFSAAPDISARGLETQAADLRFALNAAAALPFVDASRVAAGGVGINASGALAFALQMPELKALVSLDGGITTEGEIAMIQRSPFFDVESVRMPILAVNAPHADVDANRLDLYRYSTRHLVHFPRMGEFWFLDWGMIEGRVPRVIGTPPGDTREGFAGAVRYVKTFLDAYLRGTAAAARVLRGAPEQMGLQRELARAETREGLPRPPLVAELRDTLRRGGLARLRTFVLARRERDPFPVSMDRFTELSAAAAEDGDSLWVNRIGIASLRVELYPASSRALYALGAAMRSAGDTNSARIHFAGALRLVATDNDPALDAFARARLIQRINAALGTTR